MRCQPCILSLLIPLLISCGDSRTESGQSETVHRECSADGKQTDPQNDKDLGSQRRSKTTCDSDNSRNGTDTKSNSQAKSNTDASVVSSSQPHGCYGDYVRKYADLLNAYDLRIQSDNKPRNEDNGKEECNTVSVDLGSQRRVNVACSVNEKVHGETLGSRNRTEKDQTIEEWGYYHYVSYGKAEGRSLPFSCPWVVKPTRRRCLVKGTLLGDIIGPNLNGRWNGYLTSYTGTTSVGSASVSHKGTRVVIQTNLGLTWSGSINNAGIMNLCDSKGEDWTTLFGPASTTSIRLADFVIKNYRMLGTDILYLSR